MRAHYIACARQRSHVWTRPAEPVIDVMEALARVVVLIFCRINRSNPYRQSADTASNDPEAQAQAIGAYLQARIDAGSIIDTAMNGRESDGLFDGDKIGR